jgi:hypothetical protein
MTKGEIMSENKEYNVVPVEVVPKFEISLTESKNRWEELQAFIKEQMVDGTDYGKIPGSQKPTLYKPGAEKLMNIHGGYPEFVRITTVEDHEKGYYFYSYKCVIRNKKSCIIMGEGIGSCNTKEKQNWVKNAWAAANTVDKMAQKRAMVAAVLISYRLSAQYTQDLEDHDVSLHNITTANQQQASSRKLACSMCQKPISDAVSKYSMENYHAEICYSCQGNKDYETKTE